MLRFVHISDSHIGSTADFTRYGQNTLDCLHELVRHLNDDLTFTPDFVMHTGDVTNDPDNAATQLAADAMSALKYPVHYVVGNHDGRAQMREFLLREASSEAHIYYDFHQEDYHCLVVDTRGPIDPQGLITEDQLTWLASTCAASTAPSLVLFMHHLPVRIHVPWMDDPDVMGMRVMNAEALFDVLKPYREKLRGIFFGHIHRASSHWYDGILCSSAASSFRQLHLLPNAEAPSIDPHTLPGYSIVTITHEQTNVVHVAVPPSQ